jgi:hypothetical protein
MPFAFAAENWSILIEERKKALKNFRVKACVAYASFISAYAQSSEG